MFKLKSISLLILFFFTGVNVFAQSSFKIENGNFILNGKPTKIYSGEIHYPRIPHQYWKDRLLKIKATGFNTISTYAFWDMHEPQPGVWDFSGDNNIAAFIRTAKEVGLNVILRPGPYICGEWDFGGFPAWLLNIPGVKLRCNNPAFMKATENYMVHLGQQLKRLQIQNGGPIIMVQLENEYGAYGNDTVYLKALKKILIRAGFNTPFFSANNPEDKMFINGSLHGVMNVVNYGANSNILPQNAFTKLDQYQSGNLPGMSGEYWTGWFTNWGDKAFANPDFNIQKRDIEWMLKNGKSFNCYMAEGGTNFGFTAGANNWGGKYLPYITSYDYAAPISEGGIPTQRAYAIRSLIKKYATWNIPDYPKPSPVINISEIKMQATAFLWDNLPKPVFAAQTKSMEQLGQNFGYILYRTHLTGTRSGLMHVYDLHDYASVFLNGKKIGILDRMKGIDTIRIPEVKSEKITLDILVAAFGRNNYGERMLDDQKGITKYVSFEPFTQMNWQMYCLPMDNAYLNKLGFSSKLTNSKEGSFFKGSFQINELGDTYLDLSNYKCGFVVVNGHNLGRYWNKGPQKRLYCPAPWLLRGKNEIIIFDMEGENAANVIGYKTSE